jgi:hypothetical protein
VPEDRSGLRPLCCLWCHLRLGRVLLPLLPLRLQQHLLLRAVVTVLLLLERKALQL